MENLTKKLCLIGDPAVGKTSLVKRFVLDLFEDKYIVTLGSKVTKKNKKLEMQELGLEVELKYLIWDVMGQRDWAHTHRTSYAASTGALVVMDLTRKETLDNIPVWVEGLRSVVKKDIPFVLVANKNDLEPAVQESEVKEMAERFNVKYIVTSAKTGDKVEDAFEWLGKEIVIDHYKNAR